MILEIRTYRATPGARDELLRLLRDEGLPLLDQHGITVVALGPSLVEEDGHQEAYLIRAFASLPARAAQEAAFYGSEQWRTGPREAILSRIESYHTVVIETSEQAVRALQQSIR